jgi:hypothetical protein
LFFNVSYGDVVAGDVEGFRGGDFFFEEELPVAGGGRGGGATRVFSFGALPRIGR